MKIYSRKYMNMSISTKVRCRGLHGVPAHDGFIYGNKNSIPILGKKPVEQYITKCLQSCTLILNKPVWSNCWSNKTIVSRNKEALLTSMILLQSSCIYWPHICFSSAFIFSPKWKEKRKKKNLDKLQMKQKCAFLSSENRRFFPVI